MIRLSDALEPSKPQPSGVSFAAEPVVPKFVDKADVAMDAALIFCAFKGWHGSLKPSGVHYWGGNMLHDSSTWLEVLFNCWSRFAGKGVENDFEYCQHSLWFDKPDGYWRYCSECDCYLEGQFLRCWEHEYFSCWSCYNTIAPAQRTMIEMH